MHVKYIRRHRLIKKNPDQEVSEAVEPIVYYLDRGVPEPVKSALLEGGSWWNEAFEAARSKINASTMLGQSKNVFQAANIYK